MAAVLPLLGGILTAISKIGEYLVPPIKRHVDYFCCYSSNIKDLQDQIEKLDDKKKGVQLLVCAAQKNLETIGPDVEKWLEKVDEIVEDAGRLLEDTTKVPEGCIKGRCLNFKSSYQLSRRAKKMSKNAIQLQEDREKFAAVSYPAHPGEIIEPVIEPDNKFVTRKSVEEKVMATLLNSKDSIISLCGMGGIGKTTMVERIGNILKEKKLFDEVVMAAITQQPDYKRIQNEIAEILGLKLMEENSSIRAKRLHKRMSVGRILLILDDIWEWLDLDQLGIPSGTDTCTCKILLTSRARDVCAQMGAQVIFPLEVLSPDEAWILFSEQAGISEAKCKGLPLALVSVARALRLKSKSSWDDALIQLKRSNPKNIPGVLTNVYWPLKLSYSHLEGSEAQNLFLLCSLFREDSNISIEDLVRYGIGLIIFNGITNLQEARNRTHALVEILKDRFLLVDGHKEGYVKMHDVVRDVAISIAPKDTHISIFSKHTTLPIARNFPNLVFLLWECENQKFGEPENRLQNLNALKVLALHKVIVLPSSIPQLRDLRTLHLCGCELKTMSFIGELIDLEILSLRGSNFKSLPEGLGKLANLRLLDLTDCEDLQIIERRALEGLIQLEELYLPKSYAAWVAEEYKKSSASLTELELLSNLTTLRILIADRKVVSTNLNFCANLTEYDISIRGTPTTLIKYHTSTTNIPHKYACPFQKTMDLFLPTKTKLGEWIVVLLKRTESLRLNGDGSDIIVHELGSASFQYLKLLGIQDCKTVDYLATLVDNDPPSFGVFPILELLYLNQLPNISQICYGQLPAGSFRELKYLHLEALTGLRQIFSWPTPSLALSNLKSIYIHKCRNLRSLFFVSIAESLLQLEELDIADCTMMEKVFSNEGINDRVTASNIEFPKLYKLVLRCLHRVTTFTTEIDRISFPQLRVLKMEDLPRFTGFFPTKSSPISGTEHGTDIQILFNKKVASQRIQTVSLQNVDGVSIVFGDQLQRGFFNELEFLDVDDCNGLYFIFSSSVARGLGKLKRLRIKNCKKLVGLLEKENEPQMTKDTSPLYHSGSPGLFHQLEHLEVDACDNLETLFSPSVARGLVRLRELWIKNCKVILEVIEKEDDQVQQVNHKVTPFPQLQGLKLWDLPNVKSFWQTNYDFEIPSLRDVSVINTNQLMEELVKIAENAKQMIEYRNRCEQCIEERVLRIHASAAASEGTATTSSAYMSCQSYICPHKDGYEDPWFAGTPR